MMWYIEVDREFIANRFFYTKVKVKGENEADETK